MNDTVQKTEHNERKKKMEKVTIVRVTYQENGNLAYYRADVFDLKNMLLDNCLDRPTLPQIRAAIKLHHPKAKVDPTIEAGTTNFMSI